MKHFSLRWALAASLGWVGFFLSTFFYITIVIFVIVTFLLARTVFKTTDTTFPYWQNIVTSALNNQPIQTNNVKTFLLLGLDSLETRPGQPALTDSMLLVSINFTESSIQTLALPRDLWLPDYQTKINALYWYGQQKQTQDPSQNPSEYMASVVSEYTQQPIHHVIPITLDQVSSLIDAVGGVDITVTEGFTDEQFPRSDVDVTKVSDPALLYETISFQPGPVHLDGTIALKFMRSRKASGDEGTDEARSRRQQQVLAALVSTITTKDTLASPQKLANVYFWYQTHFASVFPLTEAATTAWALWPHKNSLTFSQNQLSIYPDDPNGVIWHPPLVQTQNQWTYVVRNQEAFVSFIAENLNSTASTSAKETDTTP